MEKIKTEFKKFGAEFSQIKREGRKAIYYRSDGYWEVIIISKRKMGIGKNKGVVYEKYPSSEEFGLKGWCCQTLEEANKRFESIPKNAKIV